ncbi:anti-sigma factor domain-containing protein [Rhizobium helianthi]|uniref:Anti-sigma factor domain-containing protein n=1 Tax=Rhizobium helianthi TaxID=1132695 RepID=A0ABW4M2Y5_9HYPH
MSNPDQSEGDRARDEVLAGEYVLGVLSSEKRLQVEQRLRRDRAFAAIVARWEDNLAPMDEAYVAQTPSATVFPAIEYRLFGAAEQPVRAAIWTRLWSSAPLWRSLAFGSFAMLAGVLIFGLRPPVSPAKPERLLHAHLEGHGDTVLSLAADFNPADGRIRLTPVASGQPQPKSLELWMIRGNDPAISLGVLPQDGEGEVVIPDAMRGELTSGVTLAVSLEPEGGSPNASPTGPVIASGQVRMP